MKPIEYTFFTLIAALVWLLPGFSLSSIPARSSLGGNLLALPERSIERRDALPRPAGDEVEKEPLLESNYRPPQHQKIQYVELGYGPHLVEHHLDPENHFQRLKSLLHPDARHATRQARDRLQNIQTQMDERAGQLPQRHTKENDAHWKRLLSEKQDVAKHEACHAKKIHNTRIAEMHLMANQRKADEECVQGCVNGCSSCCDRFCWPLKACASGIESCLRHCYRSLPPAANNPRELAIAEYRKVHNV